MLFFRTLGSTRLAINITSLSLRGHKAGRKVVFPMISNCKERLIAGRPIASDTTANASTPDDLLVKYLDGEESGVVVFGLNRPEVNICTLDKAN